MTLIFLQPDDSSVVSSISVLLLSQPLPNLIPKTISKMILTFRFTKVFFTYSNLFQPFNNHRNMMSRNISISIVLCIPKHVHGSWCSLVPFIGVMTIKPSNVYKQYTWLIRHFQGKFLLGIFIVACNKKCVGTALS